MKKNGFLILLLLFNMACGSQKEISEKSEKEVLPTHEILSDEVSTDIVIFRLVVTFISIGEGTDQEAGVILQSYIDRFREETGIAIQNLKLPWGREGEVDNCFLLENLNSEQQLQFINGVKELFSENKLVYINENQSKRVIK